MIYNITHQTSTWYYSDSVQCIYQVVRRREVGGDVVMSCKYCTHQTSSHHTTTYSQSSMSSLSAISGTFHSFFKVLFHLSITVLVLYRFLVFIQLLMDFTISLFITLQTNNFLDLHSQANRLFLFITYRACDFYTNNRTLTFYCVPFQDNFYFNITSHWLYQDILQFCVSLMQMWLSGYVIDNNALYISAIYTTPSHTPTHSHKFTF